MMLCCRLVVLHSPVGHECLVVQLRDAHLQPTGRLMDAFFLGLQLIGEVGLGDAVGQPRRLLGAGRRDADADDIGLADTAHLHHAHQLMRREVHLIAGARPQGRLPAQADQH